MQKILRKFKNKRIIVTGHTGFKGSWLSLWLYLCGAKVMGLVAIAGFRGVRCALGVCKLENK